jgi:hypothetical protein
MTDPAFTEADEEQLEQIRRRLDSLAGARLIRPLGPADQAEWDRLITEQQALLVRRNEAPPPDA